MKPAPFTPADTSNTGLRLSRDGIETLVSLENLAVASGGAELAFFSGCETGRTASLRNQEIRASQRAACRGRYCRHPQLLAVAADLLVTAGLVAKFYECWLSQGTSKAEALRRVMLAHRSEPLYLWAPFGVFGF